MQRSVSLFKVMHNMQLDGTDVPPGWHVELLELFCWGLNLGPADGGGQPGQGLYNHIIKPNNSKR